MAPPEARSDDVLQNPHQLMLNRLSFELVERQRYCSTQITNRHPHLILRHRLDQKRKELSAQKEDLLKQSKLKLATVESVKTQIESLMKVRIIP
jgi:THO complex subunit 5